MVRTSSTMLPLGTKLPEFELEMVSGLDLSPSDRFRDVRNIRSFDLKQKVLIFCPYQF